jgi:protein involved in polysaccharide export with SLBB domain
MKRSLLLFLFFFLFIGLAFAQDVEYKLQQGDVLSITVRDQPDLVTKTRVSADGFITFPLLGKLFIKGQTALEVENRIKTLLEQDYLVSAQVSVFIEQYTLRQISILGEVKNPGKYDMPQEKDLSLLEAIALSGGFLKTAAIDKTQIMRTQNGKKETIKIKISDITIKGEKDKDIVLMPGDIIFVPESFF